MGNNELITICAVGLFSKISSTIRNIPMTTISSEHYIYYFEIGYDNEKRGQRKGRMNGREKHRQEQSKMR
jgi:hypothetical protein